MFEINPLPENWKKPLYIASKDSEVSYDDEGEEITTYQTPVYYEFNYQPVSTDAEIAEFGEKVKSMIKAVIPISYKDTFKEFDVAYLEGATPDGETINGMQANYRLLPPRNGNSAIIIYFEKIIGK